MESRFRYHLSHKAETDLDDIVSYIAVELANPQAASDFVDELVHVINEARDYPDSGAIVSNEYLPEITMRKKLVGNYIMYYLPVPDERMIYIVRIVYSKRNMDDILQQLDI